MKVKRINVFQITALLMLTALAMTSMAPAGASPAWDWIPGTVHYHCVENSNRTVSMATHPTDNVVTNKTIFYGCQQYSDWVFGTPEGNKVPITVPKESYYSAPFFLKTIGPNYLWLQVYLVDDGNGTLALAEGVLQDVDVSITVTGNGTGGFDVGIVRSGGSAPAGSCLLDMPLNMSVWLGKSETDPTVIVPLFKMNFPMVVTTGFIEVEIDDSAGPYPEGSVSMNGYYMNATGVPFNSETGAAVLAGAGAGLDIYAYLPLVGDAYTDYIFTDSEVIEIRTPPVGGIWIPVDQLALLAPYIGLVSAIVLAVAATAVFFKYKKKQ
ncbi:MAG: hypothetical protein ACUVRA_00765 [Candidatus Bathyarchaeaceae archaeon]